DMLRELASKGMRPDLRNGVANLLKALNATLTKRDILHSVGNSLGFLANNMSSSKTIFAKLSELAHRFNAHDAPEKFSSLKAETLALLREVEGSILYSPKLQKLLPMITYNLSRFSDNPDHLQDAVNNLLAMLDGRETRAALVDKLRAYLEGIPERYNPENMEQNNSKVMEALAKLVGRQAAAEQLTLASSEKLEKIVESLLSSPCNFTPLLHFIIPVQDEQMRTFAEMWIDPNEQKDTAGGNGKPVDSMHMLIVFDIEGLGQFEAELFVTGKKIGLSLFCPPAYVDSFAQIKDQAAKISAHTEYSFSEVFVGKLERSRSLMDVFKTLPHRRAGIDVKI
ncbi:MAG: antitoxin, partial [Angelakisella sp.]